jgi:hypothetical protein
VTDERRAMLGVRFQVERGVREWRATVAAGWSRPAAKYLSNHTDDRGGARLYGLATGDYRQREAIRRWRADRIVTAIASTFRRIFQHAGAGRASARCIQQAGKWVTFRSVGKPLQITGVVRTSSGEAPRPARVELLQAGTLSEYAVCGAMPPAPSRYTTTLPATMCSARPSAAFGASGRWNRPRCRFD